MPEHPSSDDILAHKSRSSYHLQTRATGKYVATYKRECFPQPLIIVAARLIAVCSAPFRWNTSRHRNQAAVPAAAAAAWVSRGLPYLRCLLSPGERLVDRKGWALSRPFPWFHFGKWKKNDSAGKIYIWNVFYYVPGQTLQLGISFNVTFIKQSSPRWVKSSRSIHGCPLIHINCSHILSSLCPLCFYFENIQTLM